MDEMTDIELVETIHELERKGLVRLQANANWWDGPHVLITEAGEQALREEFS